MALYEENTYNVREIKIIHIRLKVATKFNFSIQRWILLEGKELRNVCLYLIKCYILNKYSLISVDLMTSGLCDDKYSTFINYCYLELTLFFYNGYLDNI